MCEVQFARLLLEMSVSNMGQTTSCGLVIFNTGGADKSLARPGRKQATATEDFEFHISYL